MVRTLPELPLLFRDDDDRRDFLRRLALVAEQEKYRLLAIALMPNHVHLVGQTGETPLWRVMKRLGSGYAASYNRKYGRRGYVLENRYLSKRVSTREYLETVICYVLLNPLRGGIVRSLAELETHPWTSLPSLLGSSPATLTDVEATLTVFGTSPETARRTLLCRLREIVAGGPIEPLTFERTPGDDSALRRGEGAILEFAHEQLKVSAARIRRAAALRAEWTVQRVLQRVCSATGTVYSELFGNDRNVAVSDARAIAAHFLVDELGIRGSDVAALLGIGRPAASKAIRRGRARAIEFGLTLDFAPKISKVR